jgi:hypothetical protein
MAKSKNKLPGSSKLRPPASAISSVTGSTEKNVKPSRPADARVLSLSETVKSASIRFGTPSSSGTSASQPGSDWTNLLKQTASGGIASALSGGLGGIGGLGSLISGIVGLFDGGKKSPPPPLVEFQLPASIDQSVYLTGGRTAVHQENVTGDAHGIYSTSMQTGDSGLNGQSLRYQSTEIAAAVKNALLNSSSLNDVIAEI